MMHQSISRKILICFFLFIILTTVNNLKYINLEFFKINQINVSGLKNEENLSLYNNIKNNEKKNIFYLDDFEITKKINSNNFVEQFRVFKRYPSTININLIKTDFLGITKINNNDYLIGSNGKFIRKTDDQLTDLPFVFGSIDINDFLKLKEILKNSKIESNRIESLYYFKSNRWDIKFKDGLIIRLPSKLNVNLLNKIFKIIEDERFKNLKTLDFRQKNQIITYE